jgi:hypothetical protein
LSASRIGTTGIRVGRSYSEIYASHLQDSVFLRTCCILASTWFPYLFFLTSVLTITHQKSTSKGPLPSNSPVKLNERREPPSLNLTRRHFHVQIALFTSCQVQHISTLEPQSFAFELT